MIDYSSLSALDPLSMVFIFSVALASILTIYLVLRRAGEVRKRREELVREVEKEVGTSIPEELIKSVIEKKAEETAVKELKRQEQRQRLKEIKKANKGLLKLKKKIYVVLHRKGGLPAEIFELGLGHSYDRFSLDGKEDQVVIYYYPRHSSSLMRGLQMLLKIFGSGRQRIQAHASTIIANGDAVIINADHLKTIAPNTFQAVPPAEIKVDIDLSNAYRDRYEAMKELLDQVLDDLNKPFKKALAFKGYEPQGIPRLDGSTDGEFVPVESEESSLETVESVWRRLKERKRGLGGS